MAPRRKLLAIWLAIGVLLALIALPLARPMATAWRCYWLYENADRERARVLHKLDETLSLALFIEEGPHADTSCLADTSRAVFEAAEIGDRFEVVAVDWKPGDCELVSTLENSRQFLWLVTGVVAALLAGLTGLGVFLTRGFTRPVLPPRRMEADPCEVRCPACGKQMDEGYVPLLAAISWRKFGEPIGLPHALRGLPGTVGRWRRPRLHAFRCVPCEILTLQCGEVRGHRAL